MVYECPFIHNHWTELSILFFFITNASVSFPWASDTWSLLKTFSISTDNQMDVIEYGLFIGLINAGVCCCRGIFIKFNFIFPVGGCLVKMIQGETEAHSIMVRNCPPEMPGVARIRIRRLISIGLLYWLCLVWAYRLAISGVMRWDNRIRTN